MKTEDGNEALHPWIEPELEARLTALVLGEASDFERDELERLVVERPELALYQKRLEVMHRMMHEVAQGESAKEQGEWKLAPERRAAVMARLGGERMTEEEVVVLSGKKRRLPWGMMLRIAACVAIAALVLGMLQLAKTPMSGSATKDTFAYYDTNEPVPSNAQSDGGLGGSGGRELLRKEMGSENGRFGFTTAAPTPQEPGMVDLNGSSSTVVDLSGSPAATRSGSVAEVEDKVPFLGELPNVGRLFRKDIDDKETVALGAGGDLLVSTAPEGGAKLSIAPAAPTAPAKKPMAGGGGGKEASAVSSLGLEGTNTYSGDTTLSGGTLAFTGSGAAAAPSNPEPLGDLTDEVTVGTAARPVIARNASDADSDAIDLLVAVESDVKAKVASVEGEDREKDLEELVAQREDNKPTTNFSGTVSGNLSSLKSESSATSPPSASAPNGPGVAMNVFGRASEVEVLRREEKAELAKAADLPMDAILTDSRQLVEKDRSNLAPLETPAPAPAAAAMPMTRGAAVVTEPAPIAGEVMVKAGAGTLSLNGGVEFDTKNNRPADAQNGYTGGTEVSSGRVFSAGGAMAMDGKREKEDFPFIPPGSEAPSEPEFAKRKQDLKPDAEAKGVAGTSGEALGLGSDGVVRVGGDFDGRNPVEFDGFVNFGSGISTTTRIAGSTMLGREGEVDKSVQDILALTPQVEVGMSEASVREEEKIVGATFYDVGIATNGGSTRTSSNLAPHPVWHSYAVGSDPNGGFNVKYGLTPIDSTSAAPTNAIYSAVLREAPKPTPAALAETSPSAEPFSTFSLHVSDVSFQLAKAALASGKWPEAEKIRIEEFVNAFDYGDPVPSMGERVACRIDQGAHPFLQQRNLVRIALRTAEAGRSSGTPLRLTLLLDSSGSMERPDRRATLTRAVATLAGLLGENDRITLVSFARQPRLVADAVAGNEAMKLAETVAALPSEGGTNLEAALELAFEKAREHQEANAQNRIVLLTDGAANLGDAKAESLGQRVEMMREAGIAFDAAGFGAEGLNDEILEALTRKGDGRYYLLDRPEDAGEAFAEQIAGALRPAAKNVKVQVEFNPDRVKSYKLLGFEKHRLATEDFRNDAVDAAELAAAEAGVAVYQVEPNPAGEGDLGSVSVRFRDLESGEMIERRWSLPHLAAVPAPDQGGDAILLATVASQFAAKLAGGPVGDVVDLGELARLAAALPESERVKELRTMIEQARGLEGDR